MRKGLEPSTSGVTGRHSNQLNYRTRIAIAGCFHSKADANIGIIREFARASSIFLEITRRLPAMSGICAAACPSRAEHLGRFPHRSTGKSVLKVRRCGRWNLFMQNIRRTGRPSKHPRGIPMRPVSQNWAHRHRSPVSHAATDSALVAGCFARTVLMPHRQFPWHRAGSRP